MPEEKKSRYTEAQKRAAEKYLKESVEDIRIRVPKGQKSIIKKHAEAKGESMNAFIIRAIDMRMEIDQEVPGQEAPIVEQIEPQSVEQEQVKENAFKPFTEADREQIDCDKLLSDILYQYEIMQNYGSDVLAQLLEQARESKESVEQED